MFPAICFGLGTWQLYRWRWKTNLLQDIEDGLERPPLDYFREDPANLEKIRFRRLKLSDCQYPEDRVVLVGPRGAQEIFPKEKFASMLIRKFRGPDDKYYLLNEGWLPWRAPIPKSRIAPENIRVVLDRSEAVSIFAQKNDPSKGEWRWKDIDAIAKYLGTEPVMFKRIQSPGDNYRGTIPSKATFEISNRHLEYILTWYGVGIATALLSKLKR